MLNLENFDASTTRKMTRLTTRGGAALSDCAREALAYALIERSDVSFTHNDGHYEIQCPTSEMIWRGCGRGDKEKS